MTELLKITQEELKDKRLTGLDDTPALSYVAMQARFDAHPDKNTEVINENARRQNENNSAISLKITDIEANLAKKQNLEEGKVLSSNDFTNEEKAKLLGIEEGANKYDDSALRRRTADVERRMTYVEYDVDRQEKEFVNCYGRINGNAREIAQNRNNIDINSSRISMCETNVSNKVDKIEGKGLSQRDFSDAEKKKLASIEEGANNYTLPAATDISLGGVKQGGFIKISSDGTIEAAEIEHLYGKAPEINTEAKGNGIAIFRKNTLSYPELYVVAPGSYPYTPPGEPPRQREYYWNRLVNEKELSKKADTTYVDNNFSNALKANVSSSVITADDVSPVEHSVECKVESENLFDINKQQLTNAKYENGIYSTTVTDGEGDGKLRIKIVMWHNYASKIPNAQKISQAILQTGITTVNLKSTDTIDAIWVSKAGNTVQSDITMPVSLPANTDITVSLNILTLGVNDWSFKDIKIQKGTVATPYTPYISDLTQVKVSRCGKNLFNPQFFLDNGMTENPNGEYYIKTSGAFSSNPFFENKAKTNKHMFISYDAKYVNNSGSGRGLYIKAFYLDGTSEEIYGVESNVGYQHFAKELIKPVEKLMFTYGAFSAITYFKNFQISYTSDRYEPYRGQEYTPLSDGTVEGMTSLSPNMTILTDTEGVTINSEYNQDGMEVIKKLSDRIAALEGVKTNI